MILPPSSSADVISAVTLCFAAGDIRGPLEIKINGEYEVSNAAQTHRSAPFSKPPFTFSSLDLSTSPGNQSDVSPTMMAI